MTEKNDRPYIGKLELPPGTQVTWTADGRPFYVIVPNIDGVHDATWSPFDEDGNLDEQRLAAEGFTNIGALTEEPKK